MAGNHLGRNRFSVLDRTDRLRRSDLATCEINTFATGPCTSLPASLEAPDKSIPPTRKTPPAMERESPTGAIHAFAIFYTMVHDRSPRPPLAAGLLASSTTDTKGPTHHRHSHHNASTAPDYPQQPETQDDQGSLAVSSAGYLTRSTSSATVSADSERMTLHHNGYAQARANARTRRRSRAICRS